MPDIKWIKITTDIFDDDRIKLIDALPGRDAILAIWFKLLTQAGKTGKYNSSGQLLLNDEPYSDEMLSTVFDRPLNTVRLAIKTFESFKMIEIIDGIIALPIGKDTKVVL